jgi:hypothetical protein
MAKKLKIDYKRDLHVWLDTPPDGRPIGVRMVELDEGQRAYMPERLFIEVTPDAEPGSRRRDSATGLVISTRSHDSPRSDEARLESSFSTGRQVVIDADTNKDGGLEIRSVTVYRPDGTLKAEDLTKGLRIREWAEEGLRQATGTMSATISTGGLSEGDRWALGRSVSQEIAERVRNRPPVGRGRRKPTPAVERAGELYSDGKNVSEIRLALLEELGIERSERSIRRWIDEMRASEETTG